MDKLILQKVLRLIWDIAPISRITLSKMTGYSTASITQIVAQLQAKQLIVEDGYEDSGGGRKPVQLRINPENGYAIGLDMGAATTRVVITDFEGKIIYQDSGKTDNSSGAKVALPRLMNKIKQIIKQRNINYGSIKGIGFGISGVVETKRGYCCFCPNIKGWKNVSIEDSVKEVLPLPVLVDCTSRSMALAERKFGIAKGIDNFISVDVGIGIGAGIFVNGKLYQGRQGIAGEIGHQSILENGPLCGCGNYGCLESLASGPAIVARAKKALSGGVRSSLREMCHHDLNNLTPELIYRAAVENKDKLAFNILSKTGEYLGRGIANVVNFLNPELIILNGGVIKAGEILINSFKSTLRERTLESAYNNLRIELSPLRDIAGAQGAALMVLNHFFENIKL